MPTAPTTPPDITALSTPPNRIGTTDTAFVAAVDTFFSELPTFGTEQNTQATWQETTAQEVYDNAVEAADSATNAANSATSAANSSNFEGDWSSLTGELNTPSSVYHDGAFWELLNNLADVTSSEPSPTNSDWAFNNGTRWVPYTASATLNANSLNHVLATVSAVDFTQPTFAENDFVVVSNSKSSTETVRFLNPSNTIIGKSSTVSAGDNIVLAPGDTMHLYARSSTILEEV